MKEWPRSKLGELAPISRRPIQIDLKAEYPELGVRSFGKGTFHKPPLSGADVGNKRLFKIEPGDLVFSNVFAWEGAVAVAKPEDSGRFGSHRFITCIVDKDRADPKFLCSYLTASNEGLEQLRRASPGGAGRNRTLGIEKLADISVPVPPLSEQHTIVARLDALADKTRQLTAHLNAVDEYASAMLVSLHHRLSNNRKVRLSDLIELNEDSVPVDVGNVYPQVGVRGFGGGLFAKAAVTAAETSYRAFNRLHPGAILMSQVKGWEGALALVPSELSGRFVSPEYRTFHCKPDKASPEYLGELIKTPWFWSLLQGATRGVGARRERTRPEQFLNIELPMPHLVDQEQALELLSRLTTLKARHAAIREANAALLPATLERLFADAA